MKTRGKTARDGKNTSATGTRRLKHEPQQETDAARHGHAVQAHSRHRTHHLHRHVRKRAVNKDRSLVHLEPWKKPQRLRHARTHRLAARQRELCERA
jgi:hypothetical protein